MSLDYSQTPQYHYDLAKELAVLRSKGVLIVGSGNIVHNLGLIAWDKMNEPNFGFDWAIEANEKMKKLILENNHKELINYTSQGKSFSLAIPSPDHYLPLLYTLALQEEKETISIFNDKAVMGSLTMTSFKIG
jgi:4,5-DOPA dioxygenase extradiol